MSSDESASTNISTFSNRNDITPELNVHKLEKWEINVIGNFVLYLYHRLILTPNNEWLVEKSKMRTEFLQYVSTDMRQKLKDASGSDNIGSLLHRCGFLLNSKRGSSVYLIKYKAVFDFRNEKLKELDDLKLNCEGTANDKLSETSLLNLMTNNPITLEDNFEIDETQAKLPLEYQGSIIQRRIETFCPTNMSCYICQEDFLNIDSFEEHIQSHGEDSDFEFLNLLDKFDSPIFTMNYRLCKNSHNFCFEFETSLVNLIIERIIIVQSRSVFYVHNMRVPYKCPDDGKHRFFVDSHLFTIHVEQPIVLICHLEDNKEFRMVEQHHFMRTEEFPKVTFSINPYRLPNKKTFSPKFQLADYFPPKEIQDALNDDFYYENLMETSNEFRDYVRNGKNLQPQTIDASLNILLQIEDMDTIRQYFNLGQKNVKLRSYGNEYSFQVKSKSRIFVENILTVYDEVVLTTRTDIFTKAEEVIQLILKSKSDIKATKNTFVGLIQAVNSGRVSFKCDQKINIRDSYTVICRPSRLTLRYQYRSLQLLPTNMNFLKNILFPAKIMPMPLPSISLNLYNSNINPEQLQAIRNIVEGPRSDATYIIFGPPGTGKTTTLVESILQILKKPNTKVLATAASNSACDEIGLRLLKYLKKIDIRRGMVRIYSRSSEVRSETIDDELLENSNMYNGQFYPDVDILHEYRVVICTFSVVAKLATGKFGRDTLYTHVFIDEVAASMETEALMVITSILTPSSRLIISGDHKQLGPILQSKRAKELGLDTSLMDRLLARDCYRVDVDSGNYDRTIQTRLVRNYRSHPAIVNLFSGLYYNHSLESLAKLDDVSLCKIWHKSRNKEYPILFHAIYEPSKADKHSLYNLKELYVVMDYVKDLMYFGIDGEPVKESDIGIISPYKKQYKLIQEELNLRKWFSIETGSVETFQGREKNIIIVSFVRSGTENLGFLDNPRRLNVTISRPKSLLILIGNPKTLSLNSDFEYIIKECQRKNTFVGTNSLLKGDLENSYQLNKGMQALNIENIDQDRSRRRDQGYGRGSKNFKSNNDENSTRKTKGVPDRAIFNKDKDDDNKNQDTAIDKSKDDRKSSDISQRNRRRRRDGRGRNYLIPKNNDKTDVRNRIDQNRNDKDDAEDDNNAHDLRKPQKNIAANSVKISKQHGKGAQKNLTDRNKNLDKQKIESLFNDLPIVPSTSKTTAATYTKEQLLQFQQQQQFYYDLQQNQQLYQKNNHSYSNSPKTPFGFGQPRPFMERQQQNANSLAFKQGLNCIPPFSYFPTGISNTNLSCFNNKPNDTVTTDSTYKIGKNKQITKQDKRKSNLSVTNSNPKSSKNNCPPNNKKPSVVITADVSKDCKNDNKTAFTATTSHMNFNSPSIANLQSSSADANKKQEEIKSLCTSGAANLVSEDSTAITSNRSDDKPMYPMVRDPLRSNADGNVNTSSNVVRPTTSTINCSLRSDAYSNLTPNVKSSTLLTNVISASSSTATNLSPNVNSSVSSSNIARPSSSTTTNSSLYSRTYPNLSPNVYSSASSSNAVRPSSPTTISSSLYSRTHSNVTPNSSISTSSYSRNSNSSTNSNYFGNTNTAPKKKECIIS